MSATIPENMLLSDLLKSTGYDCPDSLKDKTFDESTSGGSEVVLEDNKEVTITENGTVEITPSEGKDAMKKVTATVNVAPELDANKEVTVDVSAYTTPVEITPTAGKDGMAKATVTLSNIPSPSGGGEMRYFDGRNSGYQSNPKGFWVIGKNQTSGKACCLVLGVSRDPTPDQNFCIQTIQSVTDNSLVIDEYGRETLFEVSANVVAQAIANLH